MALSMLCAAPGQLARQDADVRRNLVESFYNKIQQEPCPPVVVFVGGRSMAAVWLNN
jgi:hypothetical protein